jgi:hypothetical protein
MNTTTNPIPADDAWCDGCFGPTTLCEHAHVLVRLPENFFTGSLVTRPATW